MNPSSGVNVGELTNDGLNISGFAQLINASPPVFIGVENKPQAISQSEVDKILNQTTEDKPKFQTPFSIGDVVKITNGPFADFIGTIDSIDQEKGKLRVLVSFFERETPVELDFLQVSKEL